MPQSYDPVAIEQFIEARIQERIGGQQMILEQRIADATATIDNTLYQAGEML